MRFDELKTTYARVHQADQICRREYALSDGAAVQLTFYATDRSPVPEPVLNHRIFDRRDSASAMPGYLGMESLSARELMKLAEIRSMVDAWVAGQLDELPPSTSKRIEEDERDAQERFARARAQHVLPVGAEIYPKV